jgi:hypothetical protein
MISEPVPASDPVPVSEPSQESTPPQSDGGYPTSEGGNDLPPIPQPAERQADPLFVPPQPAANQESKKTNLRFWDNRMSLKSPQPEVKVNTSRGDRIHSGGIQQACHTEEATLKPHAWTGIKFVR